MQRSWHFLSHFIILLLLGILCVILMTGSTVPPGDAVEQVRFYTRNREFDYTSWTLAAIGVKARDAAFSPQKFMSDASASNLVRSYLKQVETVLVLDAQIEVIYSDPAIRDPFSASQEFRNELIAAHDKLDQLAPLAEAILQDQLSAVLVEMGFGTGGQITPPPLYHVTELPLALIVSPRDQILRMADISLESGMSTDEKDQLETDIFSSLDYAALVVPVGGIGAYPTMVMQTTDLVWLAETIAHEWTHNYLTLRPLGINYDTTPELRTINETAASLAGKELGVALISKYYPELLPSPATPTESDPASQPILEPPAFDFQAEMKATRDTVDKFLSQGKIEEAEEYMEMRREVFWDNGYLIRKINQAYFAFYGAYNDDPGGGAAGSDPIGPAVTALRENSSNLKKFLQTISGVTSYEELLSLSAGAK